MSTLNDTGISHCLAWSPYLLQTTQYSLLVLTLILFILYIHLLYMHSIDSYLFFTFLNHHSFDQTICFLYDYKCHYQLLIVFPIFSNLSSSKHKVNWLLSDPKPWCSTLNASSILLFIWLKIVLPNTFAKWFIKDVAQWLLHNFLLLFLYRAIMLFHPQLSSILLLSHSWEKIISSHCIPIGPKAIFNSTATSPGLGDVPFLLPFMSSTSFHDIYPLEVAEFFSLNFFLFLLLHSQMVFLSFTSFIVFFS